MDFPGLLARDVLVEGVHGFVGDVRVGSHSVHRHGALARGDLTTNTYNYGGAFKKLYGCLLK